MEDQDSKLPEAQTQPPTGGLARLGMLAQEFQALAQSLAVEWARADEGRAALAQVLVERQTQREQDEARLAELQTQLAGLAEAQAERERLKSELEAQAGKLAEQTQALDAERAKAQEERAALEAEAARERTRGEELQARLAEQDKAAAAEREARAEQDRAAAAARDAQAETLKAVEAERQRFQELQSALEAREKELTAEREARAEQDKAAAAERDAQAERLKAAEAERQRLQELQSALEAREKELTAEREARAEERKAAEQQRDASGAQAKERGELEAARDQARRELDELKMQVEGLMRQADGERGRWQEERAGIAAERYKALSESAQLRARVEELEQAAAAPRPEAAPLPATADTAALEALRAQVAELENRLRAAEAQAEAERAERQNGLRALERASEEIATLKAEGSLLQEKLDVAERGRVAAEHGRTLAEGERDRARSESSPLWGTIESLQHQIHQERERFEDMMSKGPAGSPDDLRALEERLAAQTARAQEAAASAEKAQAELKALRDQRTAQQPALKSALNALRRTPFVPPTLRVAMDALEGDDEPEKRRGPRTQRLLFLDRDPLSVEALAQDLEHHGAEALVAHYAEEVSFFLKTSEARNVTALVADVMAFKSDQDMIERCRAWRQDLPNVALVVSYRTDNPIEAERARHLPGNLGAINVSRTVGREALLETLAKRPAKAEPPSGVFRLFKR